MRRFFWAPKTHTQLIRIYICEALEIMPLSYMHVPKKYVSPSNLNILFLSIEVYIITRVMFQKFWSWCDISVTNNATCLKTVTNKDISFCLYTALTSFMNFKERQDIYPKTALPSMHWPIKQTVHITYLTIQTRVVSAIRFHGCSMFIRTYGELSIWSGSPRP